MDTPETTFLRFHNEDGFRERIANFKWRPLGEGDLSRELPTASPGFMGAVSRVPLLPILLD